MIPSLLFFMDIGVNLFHERFTKLQNFVNMTSEAKTKGISNTWCVDFSN